MSLGNKCIKKASMVTVCLIMVLSMTVVNSFAADTQTSVTTAPTLPDVEFSDIQDHWAEAAVERWAGYHIIQGYQGMFHPEDKIVRSELEAILDKLFGDQEFTQGDQGTAVTREEAAQVLAKAFTVDSNTGNETKFKDAAQISYSAQAAVFGMESKGYISGFDGNFNPKATVTRAEMIAMLDNMVEPVVTVYSHSFLEKQQGGFVDTIEQYAKEEGWTVEEFKQVCQLPASSMSAIQLQKMNTIRGKQLAITKETLLQKVVTTYDMNKYLTGEYKTPKGFISIGADVKQYKTLEDMFYGLRLDYTGTYFKAEDPSFAVTRFFADNGDQATVPKSPANGGTVTDGFPFGGAGFTTGNNGRFGSPEWTLPGFAEIGDGGAQLFEVYQDGSELLRGVYNPEAGRFLNLTMNCKAN